MKVSVFSKIAGYAGKLSAKVSKYSPQILAAGATVGVVGTVVLSSRAGMKLDEEIGKTVDHKETVENVEYDTIQDKTRAYLDYYGYTAWRFTKLYGPTLIVAGATIGCVIGGHKILDGRNAAILGAYATLDQSYKRYRETVTDLVGEEEEAKIHFKANENLTTDRETCDGSEACVTAHRDSNDPYVFVWDDFNAPEKWNKEREYNIYFLKMVERHANDKLQSRGHVFLNEVLDDLGLWRTQAGTITGWVKDNPHGDGYIDFGLYDPRNVNFLNQKEDVAVLNFNVDGEIYSLI